MKSAAAILFDKNNPELIAALTASPHIGKIFFCDSPAGAAVAQACENAGGQDFALVIPSSAGIEISDAEVVQLIAAAREQQAGLIYATYWIGRRSTESIIRLANYQPGSIRDDFAFGPVLLYSMAAVRQALAQHGPLSDTNWAGLYELRLKVSCVAPVVHVTEHLCRIGAYCSHEPLSAPDDGESYSVTATVVIPVRNRERTIAEAVQSALSQKTGFPFNVIVVQNHSTDRTGAIVDELAEHDSRVVHIIPQRTDLGIGGCWNEAVQSERCGRFVCQLDSDDLYSDEHTLAKVAGMLIEGGCGMVVGSYRLVNFNLEELPPGIIDHREWSEENGCNNLLRVNGIGAPRAFATALLRKFPFPNVSYGEDYAVSLRISRDYKVGRIYEPLYLCRRWEDNTDAGLSNEQEVRYAEYKDSLRTQEIQERQVRNRSIC